MVVLKADRPVGVIGFHAPPAKFRLHFLQCQMPTDFLLTLGLAQDGHLCVAFISFSTFKKRFLV
jgi:hypothetical protein